MYLALPAIPEFSPVLDFVAPGAAVLDLGCGVGRLANVLAARGSAVTGVDESAAMLRHLSPTVVPIEARVEDVRLADAFDVVVLGSHLVNVADPQVRRRFLATCAWHVAPSGFVLIQHYDAASMREVDAGETQVGTVGIRFRVLQWRGDEFTGEVVYRVGGRSWVQRFTSTLLDDNALEREFAVAGLRVQQRLSPTWIAAGATDADV